MQHAMLHCSIALAAWPVNRSLRFRRRLGASATTWSACRPSSSQRSVCSADLASASWSRRISPSVGIDARSGQLSGFHSSRAHERLGAMHVGGLDASTTTTLSGGLPSTASRSRKRGIDRDPRLAVDAQRLVHAGDEEEQADRRVDDDVLQRVEPVVAGPVGDGDRAVVEDGGEAGLVALRRHVGIAVAVGRADQHEGALAR